MGWLKSLTNRERPPWLNPAQMLRLPQSTGNADPGPEPEQSRETALQNKPTRVNAFQRPLTTSDFETFIVGGLIPLILAATFREHAATKIAPLLSLSPLLLGLRYGFWEGTSGGFLSAAALALVVYQLNQQPIGHIGAQAIGLVLIGMIAGETRDLWSARLSKLAHEARQNRLRLEQFSAAYQLLKISHTELEQRIAGNKANLRLALEQLQQRQAHLRPDASLPLHGVAQELLDIVAEQGELFTAALYEVSERGLLRNTPVATVGTPKELSPFNPLLRNSLRTGQVAAVSSDDAAGQEVSHDHVIAVIPLIDASGHLHGVISINDMPFLRVNSETFSLLAVLGKRIGDILTRLTKTATDEAGFQGLRSSVTRHLSNAQQHDLEFEIVTCKIVDNARRQGLLSLCASSGRGLDESWIASDSKDRPVVICILPFTDEAGATTFISRLHKASVQGLPARSGLVIHHWSRGAHHSADTLLADIRNACDIVSPGWQANVAAPSDSEALR